MSIFDTLRKLSAPVPTGPVEYLIVGLGNPGAQYEGTRHNAGFLALDALAKRHHAEMKRLRFKSLCGDAVIAGKRCLLMKPTTYMNNSGEAIVEAMNFHKLSADRVLVLFDDISLEPGHLRIRRKGSDGGHNGIKSIILLTGKDDFPRIKLGVGGKPTPEYDLAAWVLSHFNKDDGPLMERAFEESISAAELIVAGNMDEAMNRFNS